MIKFALPRKDLHIVLNGVSIKPGIAIATSYKKWAKSPQLNAFDRGVTAAATEAIAGAVIVLAGVQSWIFLQPDRPRDVDLALTWNILEPVLIVGSAMIGLVLLDGKGCALPEWRNVPEMFRLKWDGRFAGA